MTRAVFPIDHIRSHVDDMDGNSRIFSRDCPEYCIALSGGNRLWVLVNHLKSKGYGSQAANDARREKQARRVRQIYDALVERGEKLVAVVGDMNDLPDSNPLSPLLSDGELKDIFNLPQFSDPDSRPGTHGNCAASGKLDYILLSPNLVGKVQAAGVERRGMWGGRNGTLWAHYPEVTGPKDVASDHAALWVDLAL